MFFGKSEKRRNPYVTLTVAALATVGAVHMVRCVKNASRCMRNKMSAVFKGSRADIDSMM